MKKCSRCKEEMPIIERKYVNDEIICEKCYEKAKESGEVVTAEGMFRKSNYKELIEKYSKEGWRFITVIPCDIGGAIVEFDLVFEKEC